MPPPKHQHRNSFRPLRFPRSAGIALADFIPVVTLARRDPKSIHTTIRRRCNTFPKPFWNRSMTHSPNSSPYLSLHHVDADDSRPSSLAPPQLADPNSDHHLPNFHSNLKWDVIDLARYIRQINAFTEDEVPINTSYTLGTIQDDVDKVIRATADEHVKSLQNTLTMIAHALKSRIPPKTPTATSPTFYELYPEYSPCSFPESDPEPTRDDNSTTLDSVSKFSTSSPIPDVVLEISDSVKRPVNGPNASLSYCAAVDTGNAATVVRTAVSSPNPQQWACRAHNPTVSSETLTYLDVQHPVPIKLEDLPSSQADDADVFLADHYPLPEVANDPDPEPMDIVEDDLDNNGDANRDIGEPNEVPSAAIQQLVRLLPPLRPAPPLRYANPLDAIHHHPFRMFQHFHHIPSRDLFFTEAMLMDTINGTIHLRDLPLCVRTSATISAFCINTLADPPELNIIRGLDKHFIHHILLHVIRNHMYIDELISGTNIPLLNVRPDKLLLLRSMKHTLNRATNMVVQHLNEQQRSQFLPRRTPRAFSDIDDAFHDDPPDCPMETRCAVAIIYALRLLYITHHRNYFNRDHGLAEHYFYPDHLFAIAKEIKSTAAALSLLPDTTTFNLLPRFVHDAFDEVDDLFPGTSLGHRSDQYYRDKLPYLQTEFELVQPYVTDYINSFPTPSTEAKEIASDRACELINVALFQHAIIHRMSKKRSKQPELNNNQVFIGNLPPADMFLSSFATCYPMITKPSDVQLTFDNVTEDTLAINHVICNPLILQELIAMNRFDSDPFNTWRFTTASPDSDRHLQRLFRTQTAKPIHPDQVNDPDWIPRHTADLRRHPDADLYHVACDPKRIPFSLAVRLIPVYTTGPSGQTIYQAWALPHLNDALRDPELQLFNNFLSYYHTAKENHPEFPFIDLMGSDSPVPNYGESSSQCLHYPGCYAGYLPLSICDSLSCPNQIESVASNNIITFQQDNSTFSGTHFACLAVSTRRSSLLSDPTRTPDPRTKFLHKSTRKRKFCTKRTPNCNFTHDEHGDEIPAQNDTTGENPTQNTTDSPEIHSQQLISDAETTYDEHAQTTQQLPGTQPNLAFLPPNSPETSSSHAETPSNSPPTAKSTTGPLKRFSDAFSGILTPKNVKLPHNPDATESNPQPPISTTFSTTPKIIPTKKFSPQNLNPPTTKSVAKSFATPKSTKRNYSTSQHEICQTYAKIT
ncbi:hypothetical protein MHU86_17952 [Fragilaria crotonensis]|nr:hypothetical protein MHU86_17952 [Fragilaria crotonensis]